MKQGRAVTDRSAGTKVEPISHGINQNAVGEIGLQHVRYGASIPLYQGRGLKAPMNSIATHKAGSQGKR